MQNQKRSYAIGLTALSALGRLIPHAPNMTPLGGSCLFAGSRLSGGAAYLFPLVVMVATDPIVGRAGGAWGGYTALSPLIYAAFMVNVWIGRRLVRDVTAMRVGVAAFLCSLQFFVVTNFGVWAASVRGAHSIYSANLAGLIACYIDALPFWGRTLAGDLFYSAAIFGAYAWLARPASEPVSATA